MVIKCQLPSHLQCGDAIEFRGIAGSEKLIIDLMSEYMACDPSGMGRISDFDNPHGDIVPVVQTQPLQIILETDGNWDVNATCPVSSTSSHGTTAKRFGFRPGEEFVCTVHIRPEQFEIRLNDMPFASSEHLVPVGSINGIQLDGDSVVSDIRFGHPMAIQQYTQPSGETKTQNTCTGEMGNAPSIVECRMATDKRLQAAYRRDLETDKPKLDSEFSKSAFELFTPQDDERLKTADDICALPGLQRATSYQLVFDLDEVSEAESDELGKECGLSRGAEVFDRYRLCKSHQNLNFINRYGNTDEDDHDEDTQIEMTDANLKNVRFGQNRVKRYASTLAKKVHDKLEENRTHGVGRIAIDDRNHCYPLSPYGTNRAYSVSKLPTTSQTNPSELSRRNTPETEYARQHYQSSIALSHDSTNRDMRQNTIPKFTKSVSTVEPHQVYVSSHEINSNKNLHNSNSTNPRPILRSVGRRNTTNTYKVDNNTSNIRTYRSTCNGNRVMQSDQCNAGNDLSDTRRSTIATAYNRGNICPTTVRAPLTLLDQQWDQILPSLPNITQNGGSVCDSLSTPSTENTCSSTSEENRPPTYVHWYAQMKDKSQRASMVICNDQAFIPLLTESVVADSKPEWSRSNGNELTSKADEDIPMKGTDANISDNITIGKNKITNFIQDNDVSAKSNLFKFDNGQACDTMLVDNGSKNQVNEKLPISAVSSVTKYDEYVDEPVLLIDSIPMDEPFCVVQQPADAWPSHVIPPERPQIVRPMSNRLSLRLESRIFTRPDMELVEPDCYGGDNTESVLSEITLRSDCSNFSSAMDYADEPVSSEHDPRFKTSQYNHHINNGISLEQSLGDANQHKSISIPFVSNTDLPAINGSTFESKSSQNENIVELPGSDSSKILENHVPATTSKLPLRVPSDLQRVVFKKQMTTDVPKVPSQSVSTTTTNIINTGITSTTLPTNYSSGLDSSARSSHKALVVTAEKNSTVPKLFRALSGRTNFLMGKRTPKIDRSASTRETNSNLTQKQASAFTKGHTRLVHNETMRTPSSSTTTITHNSHLPSVVQTNISEQITADKTKTPKRWFSRRVNGVKM